MNNEVKKERTVQEIQGEYSGICTKAGHIQYQINALSKDLELVNSSLRDLNFEAAAAHSKAQQAAAAVLAESAPKNEAEAKPKRQRKSA